MKWGCGWDVQGSSPVGPSGVPNVALGHCCAYCVFWVILFTFLITGGLVTVRGRTTGDSGWSFVATAWSGFALAMPSPI